MTDKNWEWLAEEIDLLRVVNPSHDVVRLDGNYSAGYPVAYAAAWQHLLDWSEKLAIPILYLQRHNLELVMKEFLRELISIQEKMLLGHEIFGLAVDDQVRQANDIESDWQLSHRCHKFEHIFAAVQKHLERLGLPQLPSDFHTARSLFDEIEDGDETCLRYDTVGVKRGKLKGGRVRSFGLNFSKPEPKLARMKDLSQALTRIVTTDYRLSLLEDDAPRSFHDEIIERWWATYNALAGEMQKLEKATQAVDVVWTRPVKPPNVKRHRDEDTLTAHEKKYAVTTYGGRQLALITLVGATSVMGEGAPTLEDEHLLGFQLADGNLSRLAAPAFYESELGNAVSNSMA